MGFWIDLGIRSNESERYNAEMEAAGTDEAVAVNPGLCLDLMERYPNAKLLVFFCEGTANKEWVEFRRNGHKWTLRNIFELCKQMVAENNEEYDWVNLAYECTEPDARAYLKERFQTRKVGQDVQSPEKEAQEKSTP